VKLERGEVTLISAVRAGDMVLSADSNGQTFYSEVVFVPHGTNTQRSLFTHISTAAGSSIKMTPSHIIPAGSCGSSASLPLVYASNVRVGDCIMTVSGEETVSAVEAVQGEGLYTIVTKAEYLVVNGIIASPFAFNHVTANLFYNIHRFLYVSIPYVVKSQRFSRANEVRNTLSYLFYCAV
jgi:Hint module